jgi:hypothetical protein
VGFISRNTPVTEIETASIAAIGIGQNSFHRQKRPQP